MSASLLDAAFDWIGEGAGRPKFCLPFASRPVATQSFGDPDGSGVHDSLVLDPPNVSLLAPVNGMLWRVPQPTPTIDDPEVLPFWPRLKRLDGSPFGPRQEPAVLQEHDLLLEVWPAAFRRLEYVFSSLEVPASVADWDLPQMPAPRWFWLRGVGDVEARAQAIASSQLTGTPDVTKFMEGKMPLLVRAGDTLKSLAEDPVEIRVWDSLGLAMDPDFVFATFLALATDSDYGGLSVQPAGSITWNAPSRQVFVVSDAAGKPYVSAGDPDSLPILVPARELSFPGTSMDTVTIPPHGVVVIDGLPVPPATPLVGLELPGEHQRLSLSPHGTLAKRIKASLAARSFFRVQVTDFAAWFPKTPNPRNDSAGADAFARYTDGNEVIPLIDGREMLREVYRALRATHVLETYDSPDHVPALDPDATPGVPDPALKARARILLTNAWIHPHGALLGRRAQLATPRTQADRPPEPEDLVPGFRVVPVFRTAPPAEPPAPPVPPNAILGSNALSDYRLWVLLPDTPLPPGTFVGLQQMAFAAQIKGDDPNLPGVELTSDIYGLIAPLGKQATTWGFAGTTGFFALRAFYKEGEPARARMQVVSWKPDPDDPDPDTIATSGKGEKKVRVSGEVVLPGPGADAQVPAIAARLEFDGTPGRAFVVIDQGTLQSAQPVVVINTRTGEVHGEILGPNNAADVRIPVEPFALRDWILLGFGRSNPDPGECNWFYALYVTEEQFQAGGALGHPTEVVGALQEAILAGVDTRLLAWRGYDEFLSDQIFGATGMVATLNAGVAGHRGQAIHDELGRRENTVHHQKGAFIRTARTTADGGGAMAFVGGIDLLSNRWDTHEHDDVEPDRQNDPWHDLHCRLRGRAVWDVYRNFRQRWNAALEHPELVGTDPGWTPAPAIDDVAVFEPGVESLESVTLATGPCTVQINRTLAPHNPPYDGFLDPLMGDLSVEKSYHRAIAEARRFIYIEEQYFWNQDMAQRLHDALFEKRIDFLFLLLPRDLHEKETADLILYAQRRRMLSILLYGGPEATAGGAHDVADRVVVYGIVNDARTPVYVHCKMMIVDDVWASISSSNLSRRSMTYDSEIGAMSIDRQTRRGGQRLARDLRVDLMAAHLGLTPEERPLVEDPYAAFRLFKDYFDGTLTGRTLKVEKFAIAQMDPLHTHYGIQPAEADGTFVDGVNAIADPDGRRLDLPIGVLDVMALLEAMDQATPGNVFGGLGSLRVEFDVTALGDPNDLLVAVSLLEQGQPESSRVALGRFPATATVNAGIIKTGLTYQVRAIASLTATPDQEITRRQIDFNTPAASSEATITF